MKAWSTWFPDLAPLLPGCPNPMLVHELRRAAQAFFSNTKAWRVEQLAKPVAAGTESVVVRPDSPDMELVEIDGAWYEGRRIDPTTPEVLDAQHVQGWQGHTGTPDRFLCLEPGQLRLYPIPLGDSIVGLKLRLVVSPSDASAGLPDDIGLRYRDEIKAGALSRLMLMPKKPWTDAQMGVVYGQAFGSMVDKHTEKAARAHVQARIPSRPNWC